MTYIKKIEEIVSNYIKEAGFELEDFKLSTSNRLDLGDFQINDAMKLSSIYHENPREIANKIVDKLKDDKHFKNINVAGPGFINITLTDEALLEFANGIFPDVKKNINIKEEETIVLDYGGANVAKVLHVGHLRSANIGEALRRIALLKGDKVISDVHLGDTGLQAGLVVVEMKNRYPDLPCFKDDYDGSDFDLTINTEDLNEIYPRASQRSKEEEAFYEEASKVTLEIQQGHLAYNKLWSKIVELSLKEIREIYEILNAKFDLWEGEMDNLKNIPDLLTILKEKNLLYKSEGAMVVDISKENDAKEMPPAIMVKSNGAYLYGTIDVATILDRVRRFKPNKIWYVADKRQAMHFESVFRVSRKAEILSQQDELSFKGFGTMNGLDGKPFKTRDGGVMTLKELIKMVYDETSNKVSLNLPEEEKDTIAKSVAIAALKYADLLPNRLTDYIFDPSKFADLEGKTGPYILYANIRMKSMLEKVDKKDRIIKKISSSHDRALLINLLSMPDVIDNAYREASASDIAEYVYVLASNFNKFYAENHVLGEKDEELKDSWIALISILERVTSLLINTLGIDIPEKM